MAALTGRIQPAVVVEANMVAGRQQHVGGAHAVERAAMAERVHADSTGHEPAGQRAPEIRGIDLERESALGETLMNRAQASARADHAHSGRGLDVDEIEPRKIEHQPAVVRNRSAHRRRSGAAQGDGNAVLATPPQGACALGEVHRLKDQIRYGAGQRAGEELPEVDILVPVGFGTQESIGDDAIPERERRTVTARLLGQRLGQRRGERERARRGLPLFERRALVEEEVEVRDFVAGGQQALIGIEPVEGVQRLSDRALEEGVGHPSVGECDTAGESLGTLGCGARVRPQGGP